MGGVRSGLESFLSDPPAWARSARVGLLTHPAAVDRRFRSSAEVLKDFFRARLVALFGPQHGFLGEKQDNMVESDHFRHPRLDVPVYSLYRETRRPKTAWLAGLDAVLVDLQDVGCRVYTFAQTLALTMEACAEAGVKVVVLDRPNPLGRAREGNLLDSDCRSFVGLHPTPMRHGLTMGELARFFAALGAAGDLEVVTLKDYDPTAYFEATGLPWVMPSPNMPTVETAVVYPGQVLLEGTNLSEGRGTTRPFETWGAPFIDPYRLLAELAGYDLPGLALRPIWFEPTFHKHAGQVCGGLFLHVVDRAAFRPYRATLTLLQAVARLWPDKFRLKDPPYEYEYERRPMDLLTGRTGLVDQVLAGVDPLEMEAAWAAETARFEAASASAALY